jgi:hypothetical protein
MDKRCEESRREPLSAPHESQLESNPRLDSEDTLNAALKEPLSSEEVGPVVQRSSQPPLPEPKREEGVAKYEDRDGRQRPKPTQH